MTYSTAQAAFSAIPERDPRCAMAHWGVAMTLFQPLWPTRPTEDDMRRGRDAVARAKEIGAVTRREAMFIDAAGAFFTSDSIDYWTRIARWAEASRVIHEEFPDDVEAAAFHALGELATAPSSGELSHHASAATVLERILADEPTHPGAIHYMIHANDAQGREHESPEVVRRYDTIAPRNPHALHMPTHIGVRLGDWRNVITGNQQAAEAALENPAGDRQQWVWDEYPHAIEYLVYAYLQVGADSAARDAMAVLAQVDNLQPTAKTAFHAASIPARYALERRDWAGAARLTPRPYPSLDWEKHPWPEAVTWFARGIGAVRSGHVDEARVAEERIAELEAAATRMGETPFAQQTEILRVDLAAWIAHAEGRADDALRLARQAVGIEATAPKPPVTPAPTLPAAELLGDLLLELARPQEALAAYQESLRLQPGRFNSLLGAARAAAAAGDTALAAAHYTALRAGAAPESSRPELAEATAFLRTSGGR